jgi:diguanylate cyclase (GGDEF)-like protein/PAS domain S-box-containing protein
VEKRILRLLIVDDSPDDAELVATALRRYGYMLKQQRVWDLPGLQAALDKGQWDAVVCESGLPHCTVQTMLDALKRAGLELPFLVVTRAIADEELVKLMRAGAHDVVPKNQLARLAPALEREGRAAEERRALKEARERLGELENKSRAIIEGSHEALCYLQDGMHLDANQAYLAMFGYHNLDELTGVPVMNLIDKADHARFKELLRKPPTERTEPQEFTAVKNDGTRITVELTLSAITLLGEQCLQLTVADVSRRKAVESRLDYLNRHDPLTGLLNRHHFVKALDQAVERARRGESLAWLVFVDLEQLKQINDGAGYAAGDRVLMQAAKIFRDQFSDSVAVSRFGGDEFAALLPGADEAQVRRHTEALKKSLKELALTEGDRTWRCDCRLAIIPIDANCENAQKVLAEAFQATQPPPAAAPAPAPASPAAPAAAPLPETPKSAAPAAVTPAPAPSATPTTTDAWQARLQDALDHNRFTLTYQPIVNLHGEAAELFEVLLRMVADDGSLIAAGQFVPAAERCGLGGMLDRWAIRASIEALGHMHRDNRAASFFVNITPAAFHDADLLPSVIRWLRDSGVKPEFLIFETDEAMLLANPAAGRTFIKAAHKLGCRTALDNFGRNLSNTEYLRDLPVTFLKVDGGLIRNLAADQVSQTALRAVVEVAQALSIKTVAKSVEKADNLAPLWNFGVDYVQGHYFETAGEEQDDDSAHEATLSSDEQAAPTWAKSGRRR